MKMKTTVAKNTNQSTAYRIALFLWKQKNCFVLFLLLLNSSAFAQVALWSPAGLSNYGPTPWAATSTTANITVGGLTRGAGINTTGTPAGNGWGGVNWTGNPTEDATFTVTANPGYTVSFSTLSLSYRRSSTGPNAGTLEYAIGASATTYTVIGPMSFSSTATTGIPIAPVNLSGVSDLQNVAAGTVIKFRIFPTGSTSPVGSWYVLGNTGLNLGGSVGTASNFYATIAQTSSVLCNGQSTGALSTSITGGTGPFTYSWMPSGGTGSVATGLSAGTYTCFITSSISETCTSVFTISQPPVLSSSITAQTSVTCNGGSNGSATVAITGGHPSYTYTWFPAAGTTSIGTNMAAGNYTLNVTDANGCALSRTLSVNQPTAVVTATASSYTVCNGSTVTVTAGGATTYTWSNSVANGTAFTPTGTATYTVAGTNTVSGCVTSATLGIFVNANPTITAVSNSGSMTACSGSATTLSGAGAVTYTWTGGISDGVVFSPTATTTYTVYATDVNGCHGMAVITLTVNANPTITAVSNLTTTSLCDGSMVTLHGTGATTYTWTDGVEDGVAFAPLSTTSYSVFATGANGCNGEAAISLTVNPNPTLIAVSSKTMICKGKSATLTVSGASTYSWNSGETATLSVVSPTATTTYTIVGTDVNGCQDTTLITQNVSLCNGIASEGNLETDVLLVMPNPNNGVFILKTETDLHLVLTNELGQVIQTLSLDDSNAHTWQINNLATGIYFISGANNSLHVQQKIIVTQ